MKIILAGKEVYLTTWCKVLLVSERTVSSILYKKNSKKTSTLIVDEILFLFLSKQYQVCAADHVISGRKSAYTATENGRA